MRYLSSLRVVGLILAAAAAMLITACGDDTPAPPTATPGPAIQILEPSARSVMGRGAAYFRIKNTGPVADALMSASSPVAMMVELHETVMEGATAKMQPVAKIEVPANGEQVLKPGGYHIMLMGLNQELKAGDTIQLTLTFEKSGTMTISVPVTPFV